MNTNPTSNNSENDSLTLGDILLTTFVVGVAGVAVYFLINEMTQVSALTIIIVGGAALIAYIARLSQSLKGEVFICTLLGFVGGMTFLSMVSGDWGSAKLFALCGMGYLLWDSMGRISEMKQDSELT